MNEERTNTIKASIAFDITRDLYERGIDGFVHALPGLFDDDFNYRAIEKRTARMIDAQASGHEETHLPDTSDLYTEDVQLIFKSGKIYYLPTSQAE